MPNYQLLLHTECLAKLSAYRQKLKRDGLSQAGNHLQVQLAGTALDTLSDEQFLECLFATKPPLIDLRGERSVRRWSGLESG